MKLSENEERRVTEYIDLTKNRKGEPGQRDVVAIYGLQEALSDMCSLSASSPGYVC